MVQLKEQRDHVDILRLMLAELMVKQSSVTLTSEQRQLHKQGIAALKASIDAITVQVYA